MNKNKQKQEESFFKGLYEHYKELYTISSNELRFERLQTKSLYSVLDELLLFVNGLEKEVIENALQRHKLDKVIHAKLLFRDNIK